MGIDDNGEQWGNMLPVTTAPSLVTIGGGIVIDSCAEEGADYRGRVGGDAADFGDQPLRTGAPVIDAAVLCIA